MKVFQELVTTLLSEKWHQTENCIVNFGQTLYQCLKWTVAHSPEATNLLLGRPYLAKSTIVTGPK
jgi:hypothetical protein